MGHHKKAHLICTSLGLLAISRTTRNPVRQQPKWSWAALIQNGQPIAYASRALTETESRYAQIEKEMLAVVVAVEWFNDYTFGRKTIVYSDHKPLENWSSKPLTC